MATSRDGHILPPVSEVVPRADGHRWAAMLVPSLWASNTPLLDQGENRKQD